MADRLSNSLNDAIATLNSNTPITPSVYSNRVTLLEHNCFQHGSVVHVYVKVTANQAFSGNTILTGFPAPSSTQKLYTDATGTSAIEIGTGTNGIIAYSIASGVTFKIVGSYYV